jgi:N-acetylmuramic acid 6-phosphate etherase
VKNGGRLIYMGAGTSGRLGVLDASECPPTFGVSDDVVIGIIAGGDSALRKASEGAEDDKNAGENDLKKINLTDKDVVIGISAAGGARYVINALLYAKSIGCKTIGITSNENSLLDRTSDISIVTDTGAEVVTGSTRMKAGTAQKLVLNMLSTCAMIKTGKVYENLMINLKPTNEKLTGRMIRIVSEIKGISEEQAKKLLDNNEWNIRKAVSMEEK